MCENQDMEEKTEEVKVMHSQHARILKEDDEIWISSEDLNTENSSDDDKSKTKHAFKKKLKLKNRKRSSPNIKLQRPSIPSVPSTSKDVDDRLLMPSTDDLQSRSTDDSRTSDEEYHIPPISSECLSKRLSLEDWRPMRGALNISPLEETTSTADDTRKIVNETENFYNAMLYKLKSLKSCSVLKSARKEKLDVKEKLPLVEKTFKYLKDTPEVRQKLSFINKLDEEISETISLYKAEREERLSTEFELCKSINEHKLGQERGTEIFLQICNFEDRLKKYREEAQDPEMKYTGQNENADSIQDTESEINSNVEEENTTEIITERSNGEQNNNIMPSTNFVRRNIHAAKEGMMASFSLTDEEKAKIANILKDLDEFQIDDGELTLSSSSLTESSQNYGGQNMENKWEQEVNHDINAFSVPEEDKLRIGEIDTELEKFNEIEELNGDVKRTVSTIKDEEFWKKYVLDQSLKEIDGKLEKLYASYIEDEEKLKRNFHNDEKEQQELHEEIDTILNEEIEV